HFVFEDENTCPVEMAVSGERGSDFRLGRGHRLPARQEMAGGNRETCFQTLRLEVGRAFAAEIEGDAAFDQDRAEAAGCGRRYLRASALLPVDDAGAAVIERPAYREFAAFPRKGAVFCGIGRKL